MLYNHITIYNLEKVHNCSPFRLVHHLFFGGQRTLVEEDEPFSQSLQPAVGRVQLNLPEVPWPLNSMIPSLDD